MSPLQASIFEFLRHFRVDISEIKMDLTNEAVKARLVVSIDLKLNLVNKFMEIVESKKSFVIKLANKTFQRAETNEIKNPLEEIDPELDNFLDKKLLDDTFREKGFRIFKLTSDEYSCFRALSYEFYGSDKFHEIIRDKIYEHLKKEFSLDYLREIERLDNFGTSAILKTFSFLYECQVNIHRLFKNLITINETNQNFQKRVINILYHQNHYSSLIKDV